MVVVVETPPLLGKDIPSTATPPPFGLIANVRAVSDNRIINETFARPLTLVDWLRMMISLLLVPLSCPSALVPPPPLGLVDVVRLLAVTGWVGHTGAVIGRPLTAAAAL